MMDFFNKVLRDNLDYINRFFRLIRDHSWKTGLVTLLVPYAAYVLWASSEGRLFAGGDSKKLSLCGVIHVGFWAFGPPVYFFFQYHLADTKNKQSIKANEELASKVWAAVLAVLAVTLLR
jgi:hypothetical protein